MANKIVKRIFHKVTIELSTPLCIRKQDIQKVKDNMMLKPKTRFIPASTIKGGLNAYLSLPIVDLDQFCVYDGETLKVTKRESNKEWTILSKGSELEFYIEEIIYQKNRFIDKDNKIHYVGYKKAESKLEEHFNLLIDGINKGEVKFGGKKKDGYGKAKVLDIKTLSFSRDNVEEWLDFNRTDKEVWL